MTRSKEYERGERAGREAGREEGKEEGRRECLDFLRREDAGLSRKLEEWLMDRSREESREEQELRQEGMGNGDGESQDTSIQPQSIASRLPPEVLSMALSHLDSHRLIVVKRVSSQWYETIDTNASLFKVLNLPPNSFGKWDNSILEYFTRKSQNQLEQVILPMEPTIKPTFIEKIIPKFVKLLSLSASTLHTLSCALDDTNYTSAAPLFKDTLSNLQSLSISFLRSRDLSPDYETRLSLISSSASSLKQGSSRHLKHLVINGLEFNEVGNALMNKELVKERLSNVEYLSIHAAADSRAPGIEAFALSSVKILNITLDDVGGSTAFTIFSDFSSHLLCPNLKLLILNCWRMALLGETWPSSTEEFWLAVPEGFQFDYEIGHLSFLGSSCPRLRNLRVDSGAFPFRQHLLAELLEKRFDNAEAGFEVDGQPMVFLEKLIISKKHFGKKMVSRLEEVVGEVIDSKDVSDKIEIDLSESTSNEAQRDYL